MGLGLGDRDGDLDPFEGGAIFSGIHLAGSVWENLRLALAAALALAAEAAWAAALAAEVAAAAADFTSVSILAVETSRPVNFANIFPWSSRFSRRAFSMSFSI